jgi:hypothetical protein
MKQLTSHEIATDINWLGALNKVHNVGDYQFVEYKEKDINSKKISDRLLYTSYYNGESLSRSYDSLEACMVGTIAIVKEGPNSHAGEYFMKMINVEKK